MNWKDVTPKQWLKLGLWSVLYIAWVVWLGNYWWLLGLPILFDLIITKKVKWLFWKKEYKEGEKHNVWLDWLDAIIFAVVVVTFINIFFFQAFKTIFSFRNSPMDRESPRLRSRFRSRTTSLLAMSPIRP